MTETPSVSALKEFLRATKGENDTYVFVLNADENTAKDFVQAMRSNLSRFRAQVRARGKNPAMFKMLAAYAPSETKTSTIVTLRRVEEREPSRFARSIIGELDELGLTDES